jgi:hypothetical protein
MPRQLTILALALVAAVVTAATARAGAAPAGHPDHVQRIVIRHGDHDAKMTLPDPAQIPGDHLKIDDLDTFSPGETRTYVSENGKDVTVTRLEGDGDRYSLTVDGREIELGGRLEEMAIPGGRGESKRIVIRREAKAGDGGEEIEEEATIGAPMADLLVATDGPPPLVIEIVGEKDGKVTKQVIVLREKQEQ